MKLSFYKKQWKELSFFERVVCIQTRNERRSNPEALRVHRALKETAIARESKEAKIAKLRAYIAAKRSEANTA